MTKKITPVEQPSIAGLLAAAMTASLEMGLHVCRYCGERPLRGKHRHAFNVLVEEHIASFGSYIMKKGKGYRTPDGKEVTLNMFMREVMKLCLARGQNIAWTYGAGQLSGMRKYDFEVLVGKWTRAMKETV